MSTNPENEGEPAAQPQVGGTPPAVDTEQPQAQQQARATVQIDDKGVQALYANFYRVTGTPEELILDFGLNPQPFNVPTEPIAVSQRIIINFYTAKRMLQALMLTIQRHEALFGVLETDVQRRLKPGVMAQQGQRPPQQR